MGAIMEVSAEGVMRMAGRASLAGLRCGKARPTIVKEAEINKVD